jgi:hypothetical protein
VFGKIFYLTLQMTFCHAPTPCTAGLFPKKGTFRQRLFGGANLISNGQWTMNNVQLLNSHKKVLNSALSLSIVHYNIVHYCPPPPPSFSISA